jgi:ATP/maltotriose-dependent transcriptional regulator MalT
MDEADQVTRPKLLEPCVEIMVALGQVDDARAAADELTAVAKRSKAPLLQAMAARSEAMVRLAADDARGALASARRAWTLWQGLDAPYEAARVRILVAEACRLLGDDDTAQLELEEARRVFGELGAAPDLARLSGLLDGKGASRNGGLSAREVEVLRLVAGGRTNRDIASELVISERTVDRHVSNIFAKLGVSTRAAATAHAYEHDLL